MKGNGWTITVSVFLLMCFIAVNQGVVSHSILVFLDRKCNRQEKRGRFELLCKHVIYLVIYGNMLLFFMHFFLHLNTVPLRCQSTLQCIYLMHSSLWKVSLLLQMFGVCKILFEGNYTFIKQGCITLIKSGNKKTSKYCKTIQILKMLLFVHQESCQKVSQFPQNV